MRLFHLRPALRDILDRSPVNRNLYFLGEALAPHAATQRALYTVPANRRAVIVGTKLSIRRVTAAAPAVRPRILLHQTIPLAVDNLLEVYTKSNAVGGEDKVEVYLYALLNPGDAVEIRTQDDSTGGTVDYLATVNIIEFIP